MKKLLLALSAVLMTSSVYAVSEKEGNPDRFPSIGLTYSGQSETGDFTTVGASQDVDATSGALVLDTRLPLSRSFTLGLALGAVASNIEAKDSPTLFASETDTSGGFFSISGRWYFNH